jgi:hypothetical protein
MFYKIATPGCRLSIFELIAAKLSMQGLRPLTTTPIFDDTAVVTCGLYCKCFTILIYNCNDSGQYYKTKL